MLEVPGSIPLAGRIISVSEHTFPSVICRDDTKDKCAILRIGTLTGCPLCRETHPLCRLKTPKVILIWLLVGFHPATRSVPVNARDGVRQYIEKERNDVIAVRAHPAISHCSHLLLKMLSGYKYKSLAKSTL